MNNVQKHPQPLKAHIQGWPYTLEWVRGGLRLRSRSGVGSGVGSDSEVGQGWAQTQKWVRNLHPTGYKCVSVTLHVICTVTAA